MGEQSDPFAGAFAEVWPHDFHDAALLSAKLAPVGRAFDAGLEGFDIEDFVDRCVRRTEDCFIAAPDCGPTAVLACPASDLVVPAQPGESLLDFCDRLHEELVSRAADAAFVIKGTSAGWRTSPAPAGGSRGAPAVYFYCESRSGRVIHGFWRVTGMGMAARLTECYKLRSDKPNRFLHRIICGPS